MIPSDHFVRFYNEVFKFLDEKKGLQDYYLEISKLQEFHCLELFRKKGLRGMYEYWDHIRIEENCDMTLNLTDEYMELIMNHCPSLSKVTDNDAGPCEKYCEHCPGWVVPLIEKAGYVVEYNLVDRKIPKCSIRIYPASSGKKSVVKMEPI
ncbi:MAG: hypothetical protein J6W81_09370 [Lentisphaeria bacterium]|nr:hypothetical protein [Lentisphaeria bacterium]